MSEPRNHIAMDEMLQKLAPRLARIEADSRPVVVLTCGIAGAGKSTLSKAIVSRYSNFERLSVDATVGAKHGIWGADYPPDKYTQYLTEAADECEMCLVQLLRGGKRDVVLDRSFWSKEDRDYYKRLIETHGGRWVLVYLRAASKDVLRERIRTRRRAGINADSAYDVTEDVLERYWKGFEAPAGEGEVAIDVKPDHV